MRLLVAGVDETEAKHALSHLQVEGASVLLNPQWLKPDATENLWIACGTDAVKMVQSAGWIPKKGGVEALRGRLFKNIQPDGWVNPISVGVSYSPTTFGVEYSDFVHFQCDVSLYQRYEQTGSIEPKLGKYGYAPDLSQVIEYLIAKYKATGQPVDLCLDTETEGLNPFDPDKQIVCVQATAKVGIADVVYTLNQTKEQSAKLIQQLAWIFAQPWIKVIGANFKYDMLWFRVKWGLIVHNFAFDTCNGGSLVEENRANTLNLHTKVYSPELGGYDDEFNRTQDKSKMGSIPPDVLLPYAGGDTDACLRNYYKIREQLVADNTTKNGNPAKNSNASVYLNIIKPTLPAIHKMEYVGMQVDPEKFHAFGADLENRIHETTHSAIKHLPKWVIDKHGGLTEKGGAPLSKAKMIADFLFSPQGLNLKPTITTAKTGAASTSHYHLEQFKDHPDAADVISLFLDYKAVSKMHGTYYEGFLKHLRPDNRWHASYIIHKQGKGRNNEQDAGGTVTGRGSAVDPAFQCVTGDAEILTPKGIAHAKDLIDPLIPNNSFNPFVEAELSVWSRKGFQQTSNVFKSWRSDLLTVTFKSGNTLTCTPEHPFFIGRRDGKVAKEWVSAKDLKVTDQVPYPKRMARPDGPDWITPEMCTAIGVIAGVGYLAMKWPVVYVEVPLDLSLTVAEGFISMGFDPTVSEVKDGDQTKGVVSLTLTEDMTPDQVNLIAMLPEPGTEIIPLVLRGTKRWHDVMRGILAACDLKQKANGNSERLYLKINSKALALAIIRETLIDGNIPPILEPRSTFYRLKYSDRTAGRTYLNCGLDPKNHAVGDIKSTLKSQAFRSLEVTSIEAAPPGYVYDFTIPATSCFYANSILVHNTVPKHSYWGKRLRECIIAPPGHVIIARDYSQGELKVAACWAGETTMIEAYLNDIDLHVLTSATVNGMSYEEAMFLKANDEAKFGALRQNGKAGNFGLIYGMSAYGFMMYADMAFGVKLTLEEAEAMRDAFFELYPMLPLWHDRQIMEAHQNGKVRSPLGRLRHLPNINSPIPKVRKKANNQAINSPIQGTLVDMLWMSMGIIEEQRPELLLPCAQIHDQGIWYAPEDRADEAIAYTGEVMENLPFEEKFGWKPELKFTSDAEKGYNMAALQKV